MSRLIINADDLGLTSGVNRAIFELCQARAVTSATLMASAPETAAAVLKLKIIPALGVGCHIALADGRPVLPAAEIPTLIDRENAGAFHSLGTFVRAMLRGRIRETEIEAEAVAQIRKLQNAGVALTHVDTHKHTHMFPRVLRPVLRAALFCGVRSIRNPFEPHWSRTATQGAGALRRLQIAALSNQRFYFREATAQSGMNTTDGAIGLLATGSLNAESLNLLLRAMPEGTWELVCHPGYNDARLQAAGTRLLQCRETEREALFNVIPKAVEERELSLVHYGDLAQGNV